MCLLVGIGCGDSSPGFSAITTGDLQKGKALHELKCAKCHKLYNPSDYQIDEWQRWMEKMRKKAHLNDEDYRLISGYLDSSRNK